MNDARSLLLFVFREGREVYAGTLGNIPIPARSQLKTRQWVAVRTDSILE
jgi:hypothetical protein